MPKPELEAWTSGVIGIELGGADGARPVVLTLAVELLRVATLVHVMARAETEDTRFREIFPVVLATVEAYPAASLARAPLVDLGATVRQQFLSQLVGIIRGHLEVMGAAELAQAELLRLAAAGAGTEGDPDVTSGGA